METTYPNDIRTEKDILCAALYIGKGEYRDLILCGLDPNSFYDLNHRKIFTIMFNLYEAGREFSHAVIQQEMKDKLFNAMDFFHEFDIQEVEIAERVNLLRILQIKRALVKLAVEVIENIEKETDIVKLISKLEAGIQELHGLRHDKTYREFKDLVDITLKKFQDMRDGIKDERKIFSTGLADLPFDLEAGRLYVIAGRPGHGKSTLTAQICKTIGFRFNRPAVFISCEELDEQITERLLLNQSGISKQYFTGKWDMVEKAANELKDNCKLIIIGESNLNIAILRAKARMLTIRCNIPLLCVDYLQLMRGYPHKRYRSDVEEITDISRGLKQLAAELKIPIIAVSQLNREADSRAGWRPQLSDLRGSGSIEQDADVVCMVFRQECYVPDDALLKGQIELITTKNRSGKIGNNMYKFVEDCYRIQAVSSEYASDDLDSDMAIQDKHRVSKPEETEFPF